MITTKSDFMALWNAGRLGNKLRTWESLPGVGEYEGLFSIRSMRPDSRNTLYNVPREKVWLAIAQQKALGETGLYLGEMAPDNRLLIQGEYSDGPGRNKYLQWSTEQVPMKKVQTWWHDEGSAARAILRGYMDGASWDMFQDLEERYPDHTIEFSCYECPVGDRGINTIIWEVRRY